MSAPTDECAKHERSISASGELDLSSPGALLQLPANPSSDGAETSGGVVGDQVVGNGSLLTGCSVVCDAEIDQTTGVRRLDIRDVLRTRQLQTFPASALKTTAPGGDAWLQVIQNPAADLLHLLQSYTDVGDSEAMPGKFPSAAAGV